VSLYSSRLIHCCAPLRGRSINMNGVGTEISNSKSQLVANHMVQNPKCPVQYLYSDDEASGLEGLPN
jgi:hypothetical protein